MVQCGLMTLSAQSILSTLGKFMESFKTWVQTSAAICRSDLRLQQQLNMSAFVHQRDTKLTTISASTRDLTGKHSFVIVRRRYLE